MRDGLVGRKPHMNMSSCTHGSLQATETVFRAPERSSFSKTIARGSNSRNLTDGEFSPGLLKTVEVYWG